MKIAILGTRGIPNNYGGSEANAEILSPLFAKMGHEVTVYNPDEHPYRGDEWNGVKIRRVICRESRFGIWATLLYDYLCLRDATRSDFDVILELGYVPCALFYPLRRRKALLCTNMDGLEWKRSKWGPILRRFALLTEKLAARHSDLLIADNPAIQDYYAQKYHQESVYISYGAQVIEAPDSTRLADFSVIADGYYLLIARMEPENNIETILDGYVSSGSDYPMLLVGKTNTRHSKHLLRKFGGHEGIRFLGGIYDYDVLSSLRCHARLYFHGHSVGGTNPSLLEAMATGALIAAHDNPFNRTVLDDRALYFLSAEDVSRLLKDEHSYLRADWVPTNRDRVREKHTWWRSAEQHVEAFERGLAGLRRETRGRR
jgi:glycosyltransferase involved in cell wall biosynthesis